MQELHGVLLVDKPVGMTSHDVVAQLRRLFETKAVGHCGTLDPMASGLLVMLLGNATKLSDYLLNQDKSYLTTIQLGVSTDSYDMTGEITSKSVVNISKVQLQTVIEQLTGEVELEIPIYSAKKVNGKKLYEHARSGEDVVLPKKLMRFFDLELVEWDQASVSVKLSCSKGSFIRAWGHELGQRLGCGGALQALRRLSSSPFDVKQSLTLEQLQILKEQNDTLTVKTLGSSFIPLAQALPHMKLVMADLKEQKLICNGQIPYSVSSRLVYELKQMYREKVPLNVKVMNAEQRLLAILQATPENGLKIRRVFN